MYAQEFKKENDIKEVGVIAEEIGIPSHSKLARFIFNFIYKWSDFVAGESQSVIENLKSKYAIHQNKLKVVSNFALFNNSHETIFTAKSDVCRIVSVSRLEPVKNIQGIIKAIEKLKQDKYVVKYTIVGEGSSTEPLKELVEKLSALKQTVDKK